MADILRSPQTPQMCQQQTSLEHQTNDRCKDQSTNINSGDTNSIVSHSDDSFGHTTPRFENTTPRFESFVMTGDKILKLNSATSVGYPQMGRTRIPRRSNIGSISARSEVTSSPRENNFNESFESSEQIGLNMKANDSSSINNNTQIAMNDSDQMSNVILEGESGDVSSKKGDSAINTTKNVTRWLAGDDNKYPSFIVPQNNEMTYSASDADQSSSFFEVENGRHGSIEAKPIGSETTLQEISTGVIRLSDSEFSKETMHELKNKADQMFNLREYNLKEIMDILSINDPLHVQVQAYFFEHFYFTGIRIDAAIRELIQHVSLIGDTDKIVSFMMLFAARYFSTNPDLYESLDDVHVLSCAILMLNMNLHNPACDVHMTCRDFIKSFGIHKYNVSTLKLIYASIQEEPLKYNITNGSHTASSSTLKKNSAVKKSIRRRKSDKPIMSSPSKEQVIYKQGYMKRKCLYDLDGEKMPKGRRSWNTVYATIMGLSLHLHKNEDAYKENRFGRFTKCIPLHHVLSEQATDYTKRKFVFRVKTPKGGEFLFQSDSPEEVNQWIQSINYAAAAFSSPALAVPSSSRPISSRPVMPTGVTVLNISDQLKVHREKMSEMNNELEKIIINAPPQRSTNKAVLEYFSQEQYFVKERQRYQTYVSILENKLEKVKTYDVASIGSKLNSGVRPSFSTSQTLPLTGIEPTTSAKYKSPTAEHDDTFVLARRQSSDKSLSIDSYKVCSIQTHESPDSNG
uniref:PH domain-containing protein n=1 Tax=Rhabditophanes sp. KR3021 TaxID=114890 RepID=A0AC35U570_9BILA